MTPNKNPVTYRLGNKVAIVTGSAEGIGEATARLFAKEGAKTIVADLNREKGQNLANEITAGGGEAIFIHHDVAAEASWQSLIKETIDRFGTWIFFWPQTNPNG